MRTIRNRTIWFLSGVVIAHVVHFIYQTCYAEDFGVSKLSECIAMVVEDLLLLVFRLLDHIIPIVVTYKILILVAITLLVLATIFFTGLRIYLRIKNWYRYNAKMKEAEAVLAAARQDADGEIKRLKALKKKMTTEFDQKEAALADQEIKKIRALKKRMEAEFDQKEAALKEEVKKTLRKYLVRIKKLEKEQLELKESNGALVRKVETS